jgi:hypothetical protein
MHHHSHEDHNSTGPNTTNSNEEVGTSADRLIPFPRTSPEHDDAWSDPWITGRDWRVEGIDTEPMTRQQHDAAVTALAALINEWRDKRNTTNQAHDGNADNGAEDMTEDSDDAA